MAGGTGTFFKGGPGPGHVAKAAASSFTCTHLISELHRAAVCEIKIPSYFHLVAGGREQGAEEGEGEFRLLIGSWVYSGDAKYLFPSSHGS